MKEKRLAETSMPKLSLYFHRNLWILLSKFMKETFLNDDKNKDLPIRVYKTDVFTLSSEMIVRKWTKSVKPKMYRKKYRFMSGSYWRRIVYYFSLDFVIFVMWHLSKKVCNLA